MKNTKNGKYIKSYRTGSVPKYEDDYNDARSYASKASARSAQKKLDAMGYEVVMLTKDQCVEHSTKDCWIVIPIKGVTYYLAQKLRLTNVFEKKGELSYFDALRVVNALRQKWGVGMYIDQTEPDYVAKMRDAFLEQNKNEENPIINYLKEKYK